MKPIDQMEQDFYEGLIGRPIDRRAFLKRFGGGLIVFFAIGDGSLLAQQRPRQWYPTDFNAYLIIGADNRVTCLVGKVEMGQGVITSLAMQLADELDVPLDRVDMVMGDTDRCPWDMGTFGSLSTRQFSPFLRQAAAEARAILIHMAAQQWNRPIEQLQVKDGLIFDVANPANRISYGQLTAGKVIERHLDPKPSVKKPSEFKIVGQSVLRTDARLKVTGEAKFAADIQLPDMLYAKILRPPAHWATLKQLDTTEAETIEGVQIVRDGDLIAVLHKYPDIAERALKKIKAEYDIPEPKVNDQNIFDHLLQVAGEARVVEQDGTIETGEREAAITIEATYLNSYISHSPMEPHAAVAKFDGEKVTLWVSTQGPFTVKNEVAEALGIAPENVRVITPFVGGGFGGKNRNLQAVEAARLARRAGKPVQVAWSRFEEFFYDAFRPAAVVKIKSGLSSEGAPVFWDYNVYFAGRRGSQHFYRIPHHRTLEYNGIGPEPAHFVTGPWRAPGNNTNTFARESHIDMMAEKAGMDPVEYRLKYLRDEKMVRVLKAAAERFGYQPAKLPSGRGIGVALGIDAGTYVALIAEVEVNKTTGQVQVKRVVCAQDMGLVVNPAGATLQVEGCIMMGLGYALAEEIHFNGGQIFDTNFDTYELPRFSWLPKIETVLIEDREAAPQGGGEPAIICMGGVIANAIYDAIGVRLFQLPMTPQRIKAAMKS
ncbi:MAG: molybdopterin-dependent oxidoreductase [candidate division KSB1 bacterium]|nr:molybdopterin-dependent oxidoreductase [candidate division KSB1 bacterium]MDZ7334328.1 molybdopterin-dependent oxidoreductase [candidate division KSB1 bacterium]MDZ7356560.1 molybdopterin-dependent oxidoreductase [candidate division KSB1 bacterium]MDZ7400461.1 molybdopterin-dependent oxidoreductase [candidate division KSB1 bacterium]